MNDGDDRSNRYPTWYEGAFFWGLFGGFIFGLAAVLPAALAGLSESQTHTLIGWSCLVLAVFGGITRIRPKIFP